MLYFRCTLLADAHVGWPTANTKAIQKSISFLKRTWSTIQPLLGGQQCCMETLCMHHSC